MQKPITVARREFREDLQYLLNQSGLPAFVMLQPMYEAIAQLETLDEKQYQRDLDEWNKAVTLDGEQADKSIP